LLPSIFSLLVQVCDVKWLGLRSSHVEKMPWVRQGEKLTARDEVVITSLRRQQLAGQDPRYLAELDMFRLVGKHELQCLYGNPHDGLQHLSKTFLPQALLQHDYI
jgi:hypothetical protein